MSRSMYRKPCIDVKQFCNNLCIGHNVAMIRDIFVALWCSPIHAEPTGFAVRRTPGTFVIIILLYMGHQVCNQFDLI